MSHRLSLHKAVKAIVLGYLGELRIFIPYVPSIIIYTLLAGFGYSNLGTLFLVLISGWMLANYLEDKKSRLKSRASILYFETIYDMSSGRRYNPLKFTLAAALAIGVLPFEKLDSTAQIFMTPLSVESGCSFISFIDILEMDDVT